MKILAIDQSLSSIGITFFDSKKRAIYFYNFNSHIGSDEPIDRLVYIGYSIYNVVCKHKPEIVSFEDYAFSQLSSSTTKLAELVGFIMGSIIKKCKSIDKVNTLTAAKFLTGSGVRDGKKERVNFYAKKQIDILKQNDFKIFYEELLCVDDVSDSYAIALFILNKINEVPKCLLT